MSDEACFEPEFVGDVDVEAPTERAPGPMHEAPAGMPARGVALSVLWWLEGEADRAKRD
jgi:hypothetical protein